MFHAYGLRHSRSSVEMVSGRIRARPTFGCGSSVRGAGRDIIYLWSRMELSSPRRRFFRYSDSSSGYLFEIKKKLSVSRPRFYVAHRIPGSSLLRNDTRRGSTEPQLFAPRTQNAGYRRTISSVKVQSRGELMSGTTCTAGVGYNQLAKFQLT